jgi:hypothetical protein
MRTATYILLAAVIGLLVTTTTALGQGHGHASHPPMPGQVMYFSCQVQGAGDAGLIEVPVKLDMPMMPAELNQTVKLPSPLKPVRLTHYLPRAKLDQQIVPSRDSDAKPAVRLKIEGPTQGYDLWLVADDSQHNRLISLIGTWRYMAVANKQERDELYQQFREEFTRVPTLRIGPPDSETRHEVPATVGTVRELPDINCVVSVQKFFPHFGYNRDTREPMNRSEKRLNPAALVELKSADKTEERWVFSRFPQFASSTGESLPLEITLDCPTGKKASTPDYAVVTIGGKSNEIWERFDGKTTARGIAVAKPVDVAGSQYTFQLANFVPAGRLVEKYHAADGKGSVTALRIASTDVAGKPVMTWLELGKQRTLSTAGGTLVVSFGPRQPAAPSGHKTQK